MVDDELGDVEGTLGDEPLEIEYHTLAGRRVLGRAVIVCVVAGLKLGLEYRDALGLEFGDVKGTELPIGPERDKAEGPLDGNARG